MTIKPRLSFRCYVVVSLFALFLMAPPSMGASEATVPIQGKIKAVCKIDTPSVINMPDIMFDEVESGQLVPASKSAEVIVKGGCSGNVAFKYKLIPSTEITLGCMSSIPAGVILLCFYNDKGQMKIPGTYDNAPETFTFSIRPAGAENTKVGKYTGSFTIQIEPM